MRKSKKITLGLGGENMYGMFNSNCYIAQIG